MKPQGVVLSLCALLWIAAGAFGVYQLATSHIEIVRFWDEADLILDVRDPAFASDGGRLGPVSYATRKIGYAYPVKLALNRFGFVGAVYWNVIWLALLVCLPIPGVRSWQAYALKFGGLLSLPYTMKYVTMVNPTIQGMALWALLTTLLIKWNATNGRRRGVISLQSTVLGVIGSLIVLTDFKWLPFVIVSVVLSLAVNPPVELRIHSGFRSWSVVARRWVIPRASLMLVWIPIILGVTTLIFPPYGRMVYAMLFALPGKVGVLRLGVSDNLVIHLLYLGGLGVVISTLVWFVIIARADQAILKRLAPYWLTAVLICGAFSFVVWPRGARMFAPALVLIIYLAAAVVSRDQQPEFTRHTRTVFLTVLGVITLSLLANVFRIGDAVEGRTGLRELEARIDVHTVGPLGGEPAEQPLYAPQLFGGYMLPLMVVRASPKRDMIWFSPALGLREKSNWAVLNPVTDAFTIEEQAAGAIVEAAWKQDQYFMRESLERHGRLQDTIPAPFFTSPYYICELTFEGGQLLSALQSKATSEWQVYYIGNFYNREYPGLDSTEIAP